jgi:hypothetical protein
MQSIGARAALIVLPMRDRTYHYMAQRERLGENADPEPDNFQTRSPG